MSDKAEGVLTNRIRKFRFEGGELTQQQLAERVGVTRQTIIALEAGRYVPSLVLAFRIAAAFGVRVEDVFQYVATRATQRGDNSALPDPPRQPP